MLMLIDVMVIACPPNLLLANETDRFVFSLMILSYLALMAIAMYPGRREVEDATDENQCLLDEDQYWS